MALILRERIGRLACLSGQALEAQVEFVKILGGFLDHGAALLDENAAEKLREFAASPITDSSKITAARSAIDQIFPCP